jgi:hypothetical protein
MGWWGFIFDYQAFVSGHTYLFALLSGWNNRYSGYIPDTYTFNATPIRPTMTDTRTSAGIATVTIFINLPAVYFDLLLFFLSSGADDKYLKFTPCCPRFCVCIKESRFLNQFATCTSAGMACNRANGARIDGINSAAFILFLRRLP